MLFDLDNTYPGVTSRKQKKKLKKRMTYNILNLIPKKNNLRRLSDKKSPVRGSHIINKNGCEGIFVGLDPTGKVWIAFPEYKNQFPFLLQCKIFDLSWRKKIK